MSGAQYEPHATSTAKNRKVRKERKENDNNELNELKTNSPEFVSVRNSSLFIYIIKRSKLTPRNLASINPHPQLLNQSLPSKQENK